MKISPDMFERLLALFRRAWQEPMDPDENLSFGRSVLDEVSRLDAAPVRGAAAVEEKFRASLLNVPEPEASAEFRRQITDLIRKEHAYEPEPSMLDLVLALAEQYGVAMCSVSGPFVIVTISRIGLVPQVPLDTMMMFIG